MTAAGALGIAGDLEGFQGEIDENIGDFGWAAAEMVQDADEFATAARYASFGAQLTRPHQPRAHLYRPGASRALASTLRPYTESAEELAFASTLDPALFRVVTPLIADNLEVLLQDFPNRSAVAWVLQGLRQGFHSGFLGLPSGIESPNLSSAFERPEELDKIMVSNQAEGIVAGPFERKPVEDMMVSPLGVIPKPHQPNKFRAIQHLSHPPGNSVNDRIPPESRAVALSTIADLTTFALHSPGMWWGGFDIKWMYYTFPLRPLCQATQGVRWRWMLPDGTWVLRYFFFRVLSFGLASGPRIANAFADLLDWVFQSRGISVSLNIFDDFRIGGRTRPLAEAAWRQALRILDFIRWPRNPDKDIPVTQVIFWVGYITDTVQQTVTLERETLERHAAAFRVASAAYAHSRKQLQSLAGQLLWVCRVAPQRLVASQVLRAFVAFLVQHRLRLSLGYIPSKDNYAADLLSRGNFDQFRFEFPNIVARPAVLPPIPGWGIYAVDRVSAVAG